jgi:serine/threonine protein kinase
MYRFHNFLEGIAKMYDYGFERNQYFLVMELLGESLEDLVQAHGKKFSVSTVLQIGIQIIYRLEAIHKKGFVHRDIKANNFMIGKN